MQVKSKRGDEVRLYCDLEEKFEFGELIEISEEDRSVIVQVVDIEQDSELILAGEKGREIVAKIRLEGLGGEHRIYKEWSGWFPSTPMLIKKVKASNVLALDSWRENLPLGRERANEDVFKISPRDLWTLNVVAGIRSDALLGMLATILCLKEYKVAVLDTTGNFIKNLNKVVRERFRVLKLGEDLKLPLSMLNRDFFAIYGWPEPLLTLFDGIHRKHRKSSLRRILMELSLRKDTDMFIDFLDSLSDILTIEENELSLYKYLILDISKYEGPPAFLAALYYLLKPGYRYIFLTNIRSFHVSDVEKLARVFISKRKPVFIDIGVDTELSVLLRYAVNLFFTGPYNRLLEDIFPLLEQEEPLIRRLSSEEFLINGLLTKNIPLILTMLREEDLRGGYALL